MTSIKCKYIGTQVWRYGSFQLYNLLEPMGAHPIHSTVSLNTIHSHECVPLLVHDKVPV